MEHQGRIRNVMAPYVIDRVYILLLVYILYIESKPDAIHRSFSTSIDFQQGMGDLFLSRQPTIVWIEPPYWSGRAVLVCRDVRDVGHAHQLGRSDKTFDLRHSHVQDSRVMNYACVPRA